MNGAIEQVLKFIIGDLQMLLLVLKKFHSVRMVIFQQIHHIFPSDRLVTSFELLYNNLNSLKFTMIGYIYIFN